MVTQARTREELRVSIGYNLGMPFRSIEADATGTTSTFKTDELSLGGADEHIGKWIVFTSGANNDGEIRRVVDSSVDNNQQTLTFYPVVPDAIANGATAELWNEDNNPNAIHDFINQAVIDATGHFFDPVENITLHADGKTARFDIPSGISMISRLQYRKFETHTAVHLMERLFDETTDSDFTQALDTQDNRRGDSLKLTIGSGVGDGDFITDSFTAVDLSKFTHLEGWTKATTTLAAADFVVHLDSGAVQADGTDLESLSVPATTAAGTWTFHRIALGNPETDTAIISMGIEYNANSAANTVHFDEWEATVNDSGSWVDIPHRLWYIDKGSRNLILRPGAVRQAGYSLLKIVGGDKPALLTADSTSNEVDDQYVIDYATGRMLLSGGGGPNTDQENNRERGREYMALAVAATRNFPLLVNVRKIS